MAFRELRDLRPVSWHPPVEGILTDPGVDSGFWAITRYADIVTVSQDTATFSCAQGVSIEDIPVEVLDLVQSFLGMDPPEHTRLRKLVSTAFTPRRAALLEKQINQQAKAIVDAMAPLGECDFVEHVARRLPMWTMAEMIGIDPADRDRIGRIADAMANPNKPGANGEQVAVTFFDALLDLTATALTMAQRRLDEPRDDLMSALVTTEVDGERLTDSEISAFFVLLTVAGNDTTRNAISHGMHALVRHPEQRRLLMTNFDTYIDGAIEEILRWATPTMTFRRTATRDTELHGKRIAAGDKVVMFYNSANRDEREFAEPYRFHIRRTPNNHVTFGGGGPHFCLGRTVVMMQLRAIFRELLHRLPDMDTAEPEYLVSNFMNGIIRMPCRFTPEGR